MDQAGKLLNTFSSIDAAAKKLKVKNGSIRRVLKVLICM